MRGSPQNPFGERILRSDKRENLDFRQGSYACLTEVLVAREGRTNPSFSAKAATQKVSLFSFCEVGFEHERRRCGGALKILSVNGFCGATSGKTLTFDREAMLA